MKNYKGNIYKYLIEAVSKAPLRHCERSEAIHKSLLINWIASVFDLAMTVKRAFDTASLTRRSLETNVIKLKIDVGGGRRCPIWITPCKPQAQLGAWTALSISNYEVVQPTTGLNRREEPPSTPSCAPLARGYPNRTPYGVSP
jgi:hypothetical protein